MRRAYACNMVPMGIYNRDDLTVRNIQPTYRLCGGGKSSHACLTVIIIVALQLWMLPLGLGRVKTFERAAQVERFPLLPPMSGQGRVRRFGKPRPAELDSPL